MKIGLINKSRCENIIVAESVEIAKSLFGNKYAGIYECPIEFGIGDLCYEGTWMAGQSLVKLCPQCSNYVPITATTCPICNYTFEI